MTERSAVLTADDVARAVVAACRETGADPIALIEGQSGSSDYALSQARAYAAFAIDALFELGPAKIKRMLRSKVDQSTLRFQQKQGVLRWWDDAALDRVKAAIKTGFALKPFRLLDAVPMRRVAASRFSDGTADFMGDPPRGRSALIERLK